MIVYLVNTWQDYYPDADNTVAVFLSEKNAYEWIDNKRKSSITENYDVYEKEVLDAE